MTNVGTDTLKARIDALGGLLFVVGVAALLLAALVPTVIVAKNGTERERTATVCFDHDCRGTRIEPHRAVWETRLGAPEGGVSLEGAAGCSEYYRPSGTVGLFAFALHESECRPTVVRLHRVLFVPVGIVSLALLALRMRKRSAVATP